MLDPPQCLKKIVTMERLLIVFLTRGQACKHASRACIHTNIDTRTSYISYTNVLELRKVVTIYLHCCTALEQTLDGTTQLITRRELAYGILR